MKFCKDCKYFKRSINENDCHHKNALQEVDLVYGKNKYHIAKYCRMSSTLCGIEAKWFEPKDEPKKFIFHWFTKQKIDLSQDSN